MLLTNVVGAAASLISFALWVPQARLTWMNRHDPAALAGVSAMTSWLILVNGVLWLVYAGLTGAFWSGAPGLVNIPLAVSTLVLLRRGRVESTPFEPATLSDLMATEEPAG